ncbi:hypothetical protein RHS01_01196 [Rhizoctonia solani]|uniref:Uncharacterized protein n=1 Tax=Rhizoctonia solani TaxID=456999 RepID=A0A8H7IKQ8_9AGAM|nr:hypothetical protein RHS01_01196 [Rhizoctonia solani]
MDFGVELGSVSSIAVIAGGFSSRLSDQSDMTGEKHDMLARGHVPVTCVDTMTDNPEPKGKGISSRFSNILRLIKKTKNNDSNDSISIYASDDSDKKPRKIANVPNPHPPVPLVASPPRSPVVANAGTTLVISSSQESEQVRDAGAALAQLTEYTLDDEPIHSPPRSHLLKWRPYPGQDPLPPPETARDHRKTSHSHGRLGLQQSRTTLVQTPRGWRLPDNEALERCIKYYTITNPAIANIIENRQLYDNTDEETSAPMHSFKKSKKLGNQISSIAENALYNGTEAGQVVQNHR